MTDGYLGPDRRTEPTGDLWTRRFTAWGSMVVTVSIFVLLAYDLIATSRLEDKQAFNGLNETIKAMAMIAVGFWLGSSNSKQKQDDAVAASSIKKDEALTATALKANETIASALPALAASTPVAMTATVDPGQPVTATTTEPPAVPRV